MRVSRFLTVLVLMAGVLVAACADDEPSAEEAKADLCADLGTLQTQVAGLAALGADASIEDLENQRESIQEAFDDVQSSADDVEDAEIDDLEQAYDNLDQALEDIDDSMTVPDALATLQEEITAVNTAWNTLLTATAC